VPGTMRTEKTFENQPNTDKWRNLLFILRIRKYLRLSFFTASYPRLSAGELAKTIYDPCLGGQDSLLNKRQIVLNDREELLGVEAAKKEGSDHIARIHVFDDWRVQILDTMLLVSVGCTMLVAPLTFLWGGSWVDTSSVPGGRGLLICDLLLDILYAVYLLLLLDMSYLHPTRRIEILTAKRIRVYYKHSPLYWIKWLGTTVYFWVIVCKSPLHINLLKLFRVGVFLELPDSLWRMRDKKCVRLMTPVILLMGGSHWVACLLFSVGGYLDKLNADGAEAFETVFSGQTINGRLSSYVIAYVEAIYMLTGALDGPTGDGARDGNFGALVVVVIFAPIGQLVVALFIAAIVQEQNLANALDMRHNQNKAFIHRALQILGIPKDLQRRVFSMHYFQKMGHDMEALEMLFDRKHLSASLRSALLLYLYKDSVLRSPYFSEKDPNYIIEVIRVLEDESFLPGDFVSRRGEVAHKMYFVARGVLTVMIPDITDPSSVGLAKRVRELERGAYFGQIALIKDCVRTAWIRADTYVLVSSLSRLNVEPIWAYFPEERQILVAEVEAVAASDKRHRAGQRWKNAVAHDRLHDLKPQLPLLSGRLVALAASDADDDGKEGGTGLESGDSAALPASAPIDPTQLVLEGLKRDMTELLQRQAVLEGQVTAALGKFTAATERLEVRHESPCIVLGETMSEAALDAASAGGGNELAMAAPKARVLGKKKTKKRNLKDNVFALQRDQVTTAEEVGDTSENMARVADVPKGSSRSSIDC